MPARLACKTGASGLFLQPVSRSLCSVEVAQRWLLCRASVARLRLASLIFRPQHSPDSTRLSLMETLADMLDYS